MAQKACCTAWLLTLLLAWGCTSRTVTNSPPVEPAVEPEVTRAVEASAEAEPAGESATEMVATSGEPLHVTDADFEEKVLRSSKPVMVDVWAAWCGPCVRLAPTINALAVEYQDRVVIAKLDLDANPETPQKYEVEGIPTMLFFKDGQLVERLVGLVPKEEITKVLDSL